MSIIKRLRKLKCIWGKHEFWCDGWPDGTKYQNHLISGRIRYCIHCSKHQVYRKRTCKWHTINGNLY